MGDAPEPTRRNAVDIGQSIMSNPAQEQTIKDLVSTASERGKLDPYVGKRRWARYSIGLPLEITLDPNIPAASWKVLTHNISGGGLGFWSKQAYVEGETIYVREWSEDRPGEWLEGIAQYCTLGISGFLVGVAFAMPLEEDTYHDPSRADAQPGSEQNEVMSSARSESWSSWKY